MSNYFGELYLRFWKNKLDNQAEKEVSNILGIYQTYKGQKPKKVFDIGAGWGRHLRHMYQHGVDVWGIEREEIFVQTFRQEAPDSIKDRIILGDITTWKVPPNMKESFDMVISIFSSIGWSNDHIVFEKAYTLLKNGGLFLIDTDNRDSYVACTPSRTWQKSEDAVIIDKHKINWTESMLITKREIYTTKGETYTLTREMRLYSLHELVQMSTSTGFSFLGAFSNLNMRGWMPRSGRNVVVLEK